MKKITKKRIIVAAVIIFALAAAWFYGGNEPGKAGGQGKTPFLETGITRAGEMSFPGGPGVFGEDGPPYSTSLPAKDADNRALRAGAETNNGRVQTAEQAGTAAGAATGEHSAGGKTGAGPETGAFSKGGLEGRPVENKNTANKVTAGKDKDEGSTTSEGKYAGNNAAEPRNAMSRTAGEKAAEGLAAGGRNGAGPGTGSTVSAGSKGSDSSVGTPLSNKTLDVAAPGSTSPQTGETRGQINSPSGGTLPVYPGDPPGKESNSLSGGKPQSAEQQGATANPETTFTCNFSVTCKAIFANMGRFNQDKLEVLPADGVLCPPENVVFYEGESVFNVLQRELKKRKIHLEFTTTPLYNTYYIEGINNIYEFDCGELSGWIYKVNGCSPGCGCNCYQLQDGDVVELLYSCDLGRDLAQEGPGGNS